MDDQMTDTIDEPEFRQGNRNHLYVIATLLFAMLFGIIGFLIGNRYETQVASPSILPTDIPTQKPTYTQAELPPLITMEELRAQVKTYDYSGWRSETVGLHEVTASLPEGWTLKEVNRRPEPTEAFNSKTGHDCADYLIQSPDKYLRIDILPICGYADGAGMPLQSDFVVIKETKDGVYVRVKESDVYKYVGAGEVKISDIYRGEHTEVYYGGGVSRIGKDETFGYIIATFSGPENLREQHLLTADQIVASMMRE